MSWEIRTGGDFGDKDLVCSSAQNPRNCVLPADASKGGFAKVVVAVHAAAEPTNYLGFMRAPFLEGAGGGNIGEVNVTVKPGDRPAGVTVTGRVTPTPGVYPFNISINATQPDMSVPELVEQDATVVVK
jgi:hypothetical protein